MTTDRMNFKAAQRLAAFECNAMWLKNHDVDGVFIALAYDGLRRKGQSIIARTVSSAIPTEITSTSTISYRT